MTAPKLTEAQRVWRDLSGDERYAFRDGTLGSLAKPPASTRTYIARTYGETFNSSRAWSALVKLSDAWASGEEDDGSDDAGRAALKDAQ
jgi:hypothetical protein